MRGVRRVAVAMLSQRAHLVGRTRVSGPDDALVVGVFVTKLVHYVFSYNNPPRNYPSSFYVLCTHAMLSTMYKEYVASRAAVTCVQCLAAVQREGFT